MYKRFQICFKIFSFNHVSIFVVCHNIQRILFGCECLVLFSLFFTYLSLIDKDDDDDDYDNDADDDDESNDEQEQKNDDNGDNSDDDDDDDDGDDDETEDANGDENNDDEVSIIFHALENDFVENDTAVI